MITFPRDSAAFSAAITGMVKAAQNAMPKPIRYLPRINVVSPEKFTELCGILEAPPEVRELHVLDSRYGRGFSFLFT